MTIYLLFVNFNISSNVLSFSVISVIDYLDIAHYYMVYGYHITECSETGLFAVIHRGLKSQL